MSRADFEVREFTRYGHKYECTPKGAWLKDGKPFQPRIVKDDREGTSGLFWIFDGSAGIAPVIDFGFWSNSNPMSYEQVGGYDNELPDGEIDKVTRTVHRDPVKGLYAIDHHAYFKKDGVTASEKRHWNQTPAPLEALRPKHTR